MSYATEEKIEGLLECARKCQLRIDEKFFEELAGSKRRNRQEIDEEIGMSLWDSNDEIGYWLSMSKAAEEGMTFLDLFELALKRLGVTKYKQQSRYNESDQSEDIELEIDGSRYSYNFRYGWATADDLLPEFSRLAENHSDSRIVELHGADASYLLFLRKDMAEYMTENFTFMMLSESSD